MKGQFRITSLAGLDEQVKATRKAHDADNKRRAQKRKRERSARKANRR